MLRRLSQQGISLIVATKATSSELQAQQTRNAHPDRYVYVDEGGSVTDKRSRLLNKEGVTSIIQRHAATGSDTPKIMNPHPHEHNRYLEEGENRPRPVTPAGPDATPTARAMGRRNAGIYGPRMQEAMIDWQGKHFVEENNNRMRGTGARDRSLAPKASRAATQQQMSDDFFGQGRITREVLQSLDELEGQTIVKGEHVKDASANRKSVDRGSRGRKIAVNNDNKPRSRAKSTQRNHPRRINSLRDRNLAVRRGQLMDEQEMLDRDPGRGWEGTFAADVEETKPTAVIGAVSALDGAPVPSFPHDETMPLIRKPAVLRRHQKTFGTPKRRPVGEEFPSREAIEARLSDEEAFMDIGSNNIVLPLVVNKSLDKYHNNPVDSTYRPPGTSEYRRFANKKSTFTS